MNPFLLKTVDEFPDVKHTVKPDTEILSVTLACFC